jgi:hypothetical protein
MCELRETYLYICKLTIDCIIFVYMSYKLHTYIVTSRGFEGYLVMARVCVCVCARDIVPTV